MLRREFLSLLVRLAALPAAASLGGRAGLVHAASPMAGEPFSAEWLKEYARELAGKPFEPPQVLAPEQLNAIGYDQYQSIRFRTDHALWGDLDRAFQARLFHLGLYFRNPVAMHEVVDGVARRIHYSPDLFEYGDLKFDPPLPENLGFAGFRLHYQTDWERDMVAFLGASYFRAVGGEKQYGLSARGLAIDTGLDRPEEFPIFRAFWLERPAPGQAALVVHALLDSQSATGAYRFLIQPGDETVMDVSTSIFLRQPVDRLGIAPLTSMYQHGENDQRVSDDFRPEIHDSDGLALWTGGGERIWRPLANPPELRVSSFLDENPRGFGLLQRDRDFASYQDDGVYYDRRPSLWVEPKGDWGKGAVQLVEIPTGDETFDNIVAYWLPDTQPEPGEELPLAYRLRWGNRLLDGEMTVGRVIATRIGRGGIPGQVQDRPSRKFVIDFRGGDLRALDPKAEVEPVIWASRGRILAPAARPIEELDGWRANFDLRFDGMEPVDLRCYLRIGETALTETWVYQYTPAA